jgi:hypothetical protein
MALFFDAPWFEARLAERGLTRAALAAAGAMSEADLALVFKDQRELSAAEVAAFAEMLGVGAAEVASRAGVSTPTPSIDRLARIEARLERIEALLAKLAAG